MTMKKAFKWTLISIGSLIAIAILILGYYGFVPGLSTFLGATEPRDLGVRYTEQDLLSANQKLGVGWLMLAASDDPKSTFSLQGTKRTETQFTQEELTALMADNDRRWKYYPVSDTQVRFNSDGTVETSGRLNRDILDKYADATDLPAEYRDPITRCGKYLLVNPRFYTKGKLSVEKGKVTSSVEEIEIGRVKIGDDQLKSNPGWGNGLIEDRLQTAGITADAVSFTNGGMFFSGSVPEKVGFSQ
jgi:hypothetical protein